MWMWKRRSNMNTPKDIKDKILEWLNNQGYPLEMEVAQAFERQRFSVSLSDVYTDYEFNEDREIDVSALTFSSFKHNTVLRVYWAIECKHSKDKPWIIFLSDSLLSKDSRRVPYGLITSDEFRDKLLNQYFESYKIKIDELELLNPIEVGHSITQAFTNGQDVPYKALQSCIKASMSFMLKHLKDTGSTNPLRKISYWTIALPVIVVQGSLFKYKKDQNGDFRLDETKYGVVEWKGSNPLNASPLVYIVTKDYLEEFLQSARKVTDLLIEIAELKV